MLELVAILLMICFVIALVKVFIILLEVGFWVMILPLKILGGIILLLLSILYIPFLIIPVIFSIMLPLIIVALAVVGLVYLLKISNNSH